MVETERGPVVREILAKGILSQSKISDYVINPYTGCQHACTYCYARFMKRYSPHPEPWGGFVDVKINAVDLLRRQVTRKKRGRVWVSGVCDPYQPLEARYKLTRGCLEILVEHQWPVHVQTRSPLVLRDIDILKKGSDLQVTFSIPTADELIRQLFEPTAPPIPARIRALDELHKAGIRTVAMIAPLLPRAEGLAELLKGKVDRVLIDKMNYFYAHWVYQRHHLEEGLRPEYFAEASRKLSEAFAAQGIPCEVLF
jgi:DNA repair photolyase